jgi:hypothetical protein
VFPFRPVDSERFQQGPDGAPTRVARRALLYALEHGNLILDAISKRLGAYEDLKGDMAMLAIFSGKYWCGL